MRRLILGCAGNVGLVIHLILRKINVNVILVIVQHVLTHSIIVRYVMINSFLTLVHVLHA